MSIISAIKEERRNKMIELIEEGNSLDKIAKELNVSYKRADKLLDKYDLRHMYRLTQDKLEKAFADKLSNLLQQHTRKEAAELLNIPYSRVSHLIKKYSLNPPSHSLASKIEELFSQGFDETYIAESLNTPATNVRSVLIGKGLIESSKPHLTELKKLKASACERELWLINKLQNCKGSSFKNTQQILKNITLPDYCPILGIKLSYGADSNRERMASLDQIVPGGGYTVDNVQVLSYRANRLKSDATSQELRLIADFMNNS